MATIKSYTDIEQIRKLAEILPLESADMHIINNKHAGCVPYLEITNSSNPWLKGTNISPCWSLAALLEQLPYEICDDDGNSLYLQIYKENDCYQLAYKDPYEDFETMETGTYDDFVDACYEMILKLKESNLL